MQQDDAIPGLILITKPINFSIGRNHMHAQNSNKNITLINNKVFESNFTLLNPSFSCLKIFYYHNQADE